MATVVEVPAIGPDSAGLLMTPQEFDAIVEYDEEYSCELIHGVLVVKPFSHEIEASINETLGGWLYVYRNSHAMGLALDRTLPRRYVHTDTSRRKADRLIWTGQDRLPDPKVDTPTIAVELVSAGKRNSTRDYVSKRAEYREVGVVEYWIVDRFRRILTVYRNTPDGSVEIVIAEGGIYQTPLLPAFDLPLSELLDAADAWRDLS